MVGIVISISGERDGRPYFASSQARSTYSIDGHRCMVARCCGPGEPGNAVNSGRPLKARFILSDVPSERKRCIPATKSAGSARSSTRCRKVRRGSRLLAITGARISSPSASTTPMARPSLMTIFSTGAFVRITAPLARAESAMAFDTAPIPPCTKPHNPRWPLTPPMQWCSRM